jgi:hypothetical protein
MEALLHESHGIGAKEFIVWIEFQDLTFHLAHIVIKLDIRSMNVHLLKIMWGKDLLNISKIWIQNLQERKTVRISSHKV